MAFNFPNSPADGSLFTPVVGGPIYAWSAATGAWMLNSGGFSAGVYIGDTAPANPAVGQLWWRSSTGDSFIWFNDGNSSQWVQFNTGLPPIPVIPAGHIDFFAMQTPPTGWLKANGAAVSRTAYPDLFAAIGTLYGAGDGSTTFTLPDMRGMFPRGWDDGRGVDSGRAFGTGQSDALQNITGNVGPIGDAANRAWSLGVSGGGAFTATDSSGRDIGNLSAGQLVNSRSTQLTFNAATVARTAAETRPQNMAFLCCIKY